MEESPSWFMAQAWKVCMGASSSRVRISPLPPSSRRSPDEIGAKSDLIRFSSRLRRDTVRFSSRRSFSEVAFQVDVALAKSLFKSTKYEV